MAFVQMVEKKLREKKISEEIFLFFFFFLQLKND